MAVGYLPMVVWGGFVQGQVHCSIGTDNFLGGRLATEHLIERGCRHIAFLGNTQAIEPSLRFQGAQAAIRARADIGLVDTPTHFASEVSGDELAAVLNTVDHTIDGSFAVSDVSALTAIPDRKRVG